MHVYTFTIYIIENRIDTQIMDNPSLLTYVTLLKIGSQVLRDKMVVSGVFVYVESVQRRSARFVMNDHRQTSSVTSMLNTLQWQLISESRTRCKAVIM
jgi:hypothetical protein